MISNGISLRSAKNILRLSGFFMALIVAACSGEMQGIERVKYADAEKFLQPEIVNEHCSDEQAPDIYRLGPEDTVKVTIYDEEALSSKYTLDKTGLIDMPLIGTTNAAGCTLPQLEKMLLAKYTDGYLIDPSISLEISNYRPFYIIGEVSVPGKYEYSVGINVLKAVALAGGYTYRANKNTADILRRTTSKAAIYEGQSLEAEVRPGDVIFIKERLF